MSCEYISNSRSDVISFSICMGVGFTAMSHTVTLKLSMNICRDRTNHRLGLNRFPNHTAQGVPFPIQLHVPGASIIKLVACGMYVTVAAECPFLIVSLGLSMLLIPKEMRMFGVGSFPATSTFIYSSPPQEHWMDRHTPSLQTVTLRKAKLHRLRSDCNYRVLSEASGRVFT